MAFPKKLCLTGLAWSVALLMSSPIVLMIVTAFKPDAVVDLGPFASFTPTLAAFASQNANVGIAAAGAQQRRRGGRRHPPVPALRDPGRLRAGVPRGPDAERRLARVAHDEVPCPAWAS